MKRWLFLMTLISTGLTAQVQPKAFPNALNSHWRYLKAGPKEQYLDVKIIGETRMENGQKAAVWVYNYPDETDTNYVIESDDNIKVIEAPGNRLKREINFPLYVGKSWASSSKYGDSTRVIGKTTLTTPAGNFPDTYILTNIPNTRYRVGNYRKIDTIWFTPDIGITKYSQNDFDGRPKLSNGIWLLSEYK